MKKPLILIAGPTASGKTKTSVALAHAINGEIISVDSMQIYKKMDIGTAKVKPEEMDGIPHYMIDEWEADEPCSVAAFKEKVKMYIDLIYAKGKIPILVGGTGFYINAILFDTEFKACEQVQLWRDFYVKKAEEVGAEALHDELVKIDPKAAQAIHPHNVKRVIRALAYYKETNQLISEHNEAEREKRIQNESPYDYTFFVLTMARQTLYERIHLRIDQMLEEGLLEEVRYFYNLGLDPSLTSMKAIGYKEFFPYFRGEASLDTCIAELKKNTRHYAKRQLTWFKHQTTPCFIEVDELGFNTERITEVMRDKIKHTL